LDQDKVPMRKEQRRRKKLFPFDPSSADLTKGDDHALQRLSRLLGRFGGKQNKLPLIVPGDERQCECGGGAERR
jgi:hypothetical protein